EVVDHRHRSPSPVRAGVVAGLGLVVEEAAAVLADEDQAGLAHFVEALRREGHPAARADPVAADQGHGEPAPALQEPPVLGEEVPRDVTHDGLPLAPGGLDVDLEGAQLLGGGGLLDLRLRLLWAEPRVGLDRLAAEALLELHEREDLLFDAVLLDLRALALGQRRRVLLVGLDLVQLGLQLLPLGGLVLELLLLRPNVLAGAVELGPDGVNARLRLLEPVADAVDADRYRLELSLEPCDAAVEDLELLETLE